MGQKITEYIIQSDSINGDVEIKYQSGRPLVVIISQGHDLISLTDVQLSKLSDILGKFITCDHELAPVMVDRNGNEIHNVSVNSDYNSVAKCVKCGYMP